MKVKSDHHSEVSLKVYANSWGSSIERPLRVAAHINWPFDSSIVARVYMNLMDYVWDISKYHKWSVETFWTLQETMTIPQFYINFFSFLIEK